MKRFTLLFFLLAARLTGYCGITTITNSGFAFTPETVTIKPGDSVRFTIANIHNVVEVSQATWNNNGNTPLPGGFTLPFGGGLVRPDLLTAGTHWYVCSPHASSGMKGIIIVEGSTATEDIHFPASVSVSPNPTNGKMQVIMQNPDAYKSFDLIVYDINGKRIYLKSKSEIQLVNDIDLTGFSKGFYILRLYDGRKSYSTKVLLQ
ncbi:MAG: T9SS type A sorting domain-containing protein [Saprospiraceae bacterium]